MTSTIQTPLLSTLGVIFVSVAPSGCGSLDHTADLARNELFYADVSYETDAPGDVTLFVAPLRDARTQADLPAHERGLPIRYGTDDFWDRPVAAMVRDVLDRELQQSQLFASIIDQAAPEAIVLKPSLVTFSVGAQEGIAGSMTFAEVGLRLEVYGPVGAGGARPLWHDQRYGNRQRTEFQVNPVSPYRLIGRALHVTVSTALGGLDESQVARSDQPVQLPKRLQGEWSAPGR